MTGKKEKQYVCDNPQLMAEWDREKNIELGLDPNTTTVGSEKKAWWMCSKGHEWHARIYSRNYGSRCPICSSERHTSFPEYILEYYLKNHGLDAVHSYKEFGYELDLYIPSKRIAIEYDGYYWHKDKTTEDIEKNRKCERDGVKLYRIREGLLSLNDSSIDYVIRKDRKNMHEMLEKILSEILGKCVAIDIATDAINIENLREHTEKENSLLLINPTIAFEWNYDKNGNLKPANVTSNSQKKVWWKCHKGHEWQATVVNRNRGYNCPYCVGQKVLLGYNDLQTVNPTLAKEWNYEKNTNLKLENVSAGSKKKAWWKCSNGHEWQATIKNRSHGHRCPYCSRQERVKEKRSVLSCDEILIKEWNHEKNGELKPESFTAKSHKKIWWKCSNGHEWQATLASRSSGRGCPYCSNRSVLKGYNDLQTVNPSLAQEWNYAKNDELTPMDVTSGCDRKVWWKCSNGHEWQARIDHRSRRSDCPYCAGQKVLEGYNDLQTVNPMLAMEWDYEKNNGLTPAEVMPNSHKSVYWKCTQGHEYQMAVKDRNRGRICPECSRQKRKKI